jgi:hypothetical protein
VKKTVQDRTGHMFFFLLPCGRDQKNERFSWNGVSGWRSRAEATDQNVKNDLK